MDKKIWLIFIGFLLALKTAYAGYRSISPAYKEHRENTITNGKKQDKALLIKFYRNHMKGKRNQS